MKDFVIETVGVTEHIKRLQRYKEEGEIAAEKAVIESANLVLELANEICPIDTGELRESGHVVIDGDGYETVAAVTYDAPYAIFVHENLEAYHKPPTQAKWLEETLRRYRGDISRKIEAEVRAAFARAKKG